MKSAARAVAAVQNCRTSSSRAVLLAALLVLAGPMVRPLLAATEPRHLVASDVAAVDGGEVDADAAVAPAAPPVKRAVIVHGNRPIEMKLRKAHDSDVDLRTLSQAGPAKVFRSEGPQYVPRPGLAPGRTGEAVPLASMVPPTSSAPAPAPSSAFDGLGFAANGAGHPPDTNGDVGPTYFIQSINSSIGIFRKSDGALMASPSLDTFMSQGAFGNLCDTDNFGDPVVLYDSFEDRWIVSDFAFQLGTSGNIVNPPGAFQCFGVSKSGDPVSGGWSFYSIQLTDALGDYPKLGVWTDGIYMSANLFGTGAGGSYENPRAWAFNKFQMYAGAPTAQVVAFDCPLSDDFTVIPSNARLQAGTPPPGTPNYFVSTDYFLDALNVYELHVDWDQISNSTFAAPVQPLAGSSWPNNSVPVAPSLSGNNLDTLQQRAMVQNQYTNIGGAESLWVSHTVPRDVTGSSASAPRWYQVNVTGGTVAATLPQAATWDPDGNNSMFRFMPSVAVDRAGDLALGYSTSSSATKPAIKYAGRLAGDAINTFSQTEQLLVQGTGTQTGNCGSGPCIRWGDYSSMTLDPDGCSFWYTNLYYNAPDSLSYLTRIGTFAYPSCTPLGSGGTVAGTVTATVGGAPISGATVALGARTTTTAINGTYSFTGVPAGTYSSIMASAAGFDTASSSNVIVTDASTTTRNFSLAGAPIAACGSETSQTDFLQGVGTNVDLTSSPGDVKLIGGAHADQSNHNLSSSGTGVSTTTWGGQTFTPSRSGSLTGGTLAMFCSGCSGTTPNLTVSLRTTSGGIPTGADLATATITGFATSFNSFAPFTFGAPVAVTAGTMYALLVRPTSSPSAGVYALTLSAATSPGSIAAVGGNVYPGGTFIQGVASGTSWSVPSTAGRTWDTGFRVDVNGFEPAGTLVSRLHDANPPVTNASSTWSTLSWTATTPAGTAIQFQVAASNSQFGPFNFVGPGGTGATFFTTSGASLSQFNGFRYLEWKAYLSTTSSTATPTLSSVTVCGGASLLADFAVTNSDGVTNVGAGGSTVYSIVVSNAGPDAGVATATDTFPAACTAVSYTSSAAGGATGNTASGSGNISDQLTLPVGASVTYSATCSISGAATGSLVDTATVTASLGSTDPASGNNSATDTDLITSLFSDGFERTLTVWSSHQP